MDTALVTGASSGPGLAIARRLIDMGLCVYGLDADFSQCIWKHSEFHQTECDLFRQEKVALAWKAIVEQAPGISVIVHAAMPDIPGPLEAAHPDDIRRVLEGRLMTPTLLSRYALPRLIRIRGSIIYLSQQTEGTLSQTLSGGIGALARSLYREVRDTGVKIAHLSLEPNADGDEASTRHTSIDPELVADTVENILRLPAHNSLTQLTLRPQATREEPFKAASTPLLRWGPEEVRLPTPDKFPEEPDPIYTPERKRPADAPEPGEDDDEDDFEDEDDELDRLIEASRQRLKEQVRQPRERDQRRREPAGASSSQAARQPDEREQGRRDVAAPSSSQAAPQPDERDKRRRRRRGGRNRNRNRDREHTPGSAPQHSDDRQPQNTGPRPTDAAQTSGDSKPAPQEPKPAPKYKAIPRSQMPPASEPVTEKKPAPEAPAAKPASKVPKERKKTVKQDSEEQPKAAAPAKEKPEKKAAAKKTARKTAAKKAVKKAAKKAAKKKTTTDTE